MDGLAELANPDWKQTRAWPCRNPEAPQGTSSDSRTRPVPRETGPRLPENIPERGTRGGKETREPAGVGLEQRPQPHYSSDGARGDQAFLTKHAFSPTEIPSILQEIS